MSVDFERRSASERGLRKEVDVGGTEPSKYEEAGSEEEGLERDHLLVSEAQPW
jgi:hypothetical protein